MFLVPAMTLFLSLVVVLWLQNHLIQNLCLHLGLLTQKRLSLPDQMVGLETEGGRKEGEMNGQNNRQKETQTNRQKGH